jgi:hypothetical protein
LKLLINFKVTKWEQIKEKVFYFISKISVIGVKRIIKSDNRLVKLTWGIMILTSLSFGLLNTSNSISDYLNYDVITNIEKITPTNITFPAITICASYYLYKEVFIDNKFSRSEYIYDNASLKMFIEYSSFKEKNLNLSQFESFKIPNYVGTCLKFDGIKGFEKVNDTKDELFFNIRPDHEEVISFSEKHIYSIQLANNLFDIYITDNYLNSYYSINPLQLARGAKYIVSFEKTVVQKRVNSPRFPCLELENEVYRQANCIEICMNKEINNKYNCSFPSYYTIDGLKPCGDRSSYQYEDYLTQLKTEFYKICENKCPKECDSVQFKIKSASEPYLDRDYFLIEFRFSDLSFLEINQIPKMNLFDIVSSVGGTLGLFIGVTFLSVVELLELSIDVLYILLFKY